MRSDREHPGGTLGRRGVLATGLLAGLGAVLSGCNTGEDAAQPGAASPTGPKPEPAVRNATGALARLKAGNARFVAGRVNHPDQAVTYRGKLAAGQHPFAAVLSCADSRVPPEIVFDQGLGDLFVSRTAGQVLDRAVLGSIQYGIAELKIPLLVVLGHEKCGAVKAALEAIEHESPAMGNDIDALVAAITPAVEEAVSMKSADVLDAAVRYNVANTVAGLKKQKVLSAAVAAGTLRIVGARYDLDKGAVTFL